MITEIRIDDTLTGAVVSPAPNQFITSLQMVTPPNPAYQVENCLPYPFNRWTSGRFVLRDARRVLFSFSISHGGVGGGVIPGMALHGASIPYLGDLVLGCSPRAAVWLLGVSDIPVDDLVRPLPGNAAPRGVSFGSWRPGMDPAFN
jgi:hypothetical protein